jgi:hypothetical protein
MSLWYRAAEARLGIAIPTNDINYLMQTLYTARIASGDESLAKLSLLKAKDEVWIVDREKAKDAAQGNT